MTAVPVKFIPTEDFFSDETKSQYCRGMTYTVTSAALQELVDEWVDQGKVEIVGADPGKASVSGTLN